MKRILLFLFALPGLAFAQKAQPIGDFYLENSTVVYHHVYIDSTRDSAPMLANKLMTNLALLPGIRNLVQSGNIITGTYDRLSTFTFSTSEWKADFTIEVRDGRYRVTIYNFELTGNNGKELVSWDYTLLRDDKTEWRPDASGDIRSNESRFTTLFVLPTKQVEPNW